MRQLTSLDAQFLAVETPRTYGHVGRAGECHCQLFEQRLALRRSG